MKKQNWKKWRRQTIASKLLHWIHRNGKNWIVTYQIPILVVAGAVFLFILIVLLLGRGRTDVAETETIAIISQTTVGETEAMELETVEAQTQEQITELVKRYFQALADCDIETLNNICETTEAFDADTLTQQTSYIENYQNVDCVVIGGLVEGTYIVYVYYQMKFQYIDTPAPALGQLYVKTDIDGLPYIYMGIIDGELSAYIAEVTAGEQISALAEEVNGELEQARRSDTKLDAFIRVLTGETETKKE